MSESDLLPTIERVRHLLELAKRSSAGPWRLAKSGVSVDAGPFRIRMENAGPSWTAELRANAELIAALPELVAVLEQWANLSEHEP